MKTAPLAEVKNYLTKYIRLSRKEPVFITKNGRISAVLEHITDDDIEDFLLERNPRFREMLNKTKAGKGGLTLEKYCASRSL